MAHVQESQELRRGLPSLADRPEERRGRVERHRCSIVWSLSAFRSQVGRIFALWEISNPKNPTEFFFDRSHLVLGGENSRI